MITGSPVASADVGALGIGHDRDGALLGGRRGEFRAVAVHAPHRDEHVARPEIGRGQGEPGQGRSRRLSAGLAAEPSGQILERVHRRIVRAQHGGQV